MSFLLKRFIPFFSSSCSFSEVEHDFNQMQSSVPSEDTDFQSNFPANISLSDNTTPLIPERFAKVVSTLSRGSTITLRLGTYILVSLLDSARIGTMTSFSVTCGAIESILLKAERDTDSSAAEVPSSSSTSFNKITSDCNVPTATSIMNPVQKNDLLFLNCSSPSHHTDQTSAETVTSSSINIINRVATVAQLFTAASFHLATSSLQTASSIAQDTLHIFDAIFGSTDSSRALAAIISLVRREFGDGSGLYSLVTGLTCFTLLQSRGWSRTVDEIEMFIVWDVVVLDTGETLSQQFPATGDYQRKKESEEDLIISAIPNNSQYRFSINEITTKTYSIEILSESPIFSVKLPKDVVVLHEGFTTPQDPNEQAKYIVTFQKSSKYYRERKGALARKTDHQLNRSISSATGFMIDPTNVSIKTRDHSPSLPDNYDDDPPSCINDKRYSFNNPIVLENLSVGNTDSESDIDSDNKVIGNNDSFSSDDDEDQLVSSSRSSIFNERVEKPTKHTEHLVPSASHIAGSVINSDISKLNPKFSPGNINRRSLTQLSSIVKSASYSSLRKSTSTSTDFSNLTKNHHHSISTSFDTKPSNHRISKGHLKSHKAKGNSHTKSSKNNSNYMTIDFDNALDIISPTNDERITNSPSADLAASGLTDMSSIDPTKSHTLTLKKFPPEHVTLSMAKYMRFATASYGQSFMSVLGVGKYYSPYGGYNGGPLHSEHYAFAHHTRLNLDDILLSSYSDSATDDKAGIPLVHFVAIDHNAKAVVLTIRGTLGIEDILTDLTCDYEVMQWNDQEWKAHGGMLRCAQILKRRTSRVLATIREALESLGEEYGLIICGHSLGGGVGSILGILLSEIQSDGTFVTSSVQAKSNLFALPPKRRIHCFAYGPPASISEELRVKTRGLITTVVYGLDIVPCLSLGVLRDFQNVALAFKNDQEGIVADIRKRFLAQFASRHIPLSVHDADDDYLWELLTKLRGVMDSEKLVPPGEVYHISTNTIFETHDGKTKRATRIIAKVIVDVQKRFAEPVFGRGIFHHSPLYYERATRILEMGVCNAPV